MLDPSSSRSASSCKNQLSLRRVAASMTRTTLSKVVRSEIQKRAALVKVGRLKPD
jgi:hypothetical protein